MTQQKNGIILKGIGGFYYVEAAGAVYECKARGVFRKKRITPLRSEERLGGKECICLSLSTGSP